MKQVWTSADGRATSVYGMDLNHQLNSLAMMGFTVRRMRTEAKRIFGENFTNVSDATKAAFSVVHPRDVYPLYDAMQANARARFLEEHGVSFSQVKTVVYDAWVHRRPIEHMLEKAVRYVLRIDEPSRSLNDARLMMYIRAFEVCDERSYADMCWSLRADQPYTWRQITSSHAPPALQMIKKVPSTRLNTALNFERPKFPVYTGVDDMFGVWDGDIPFSAGR